MVAACLAIAAMAARFNASREDSTPVSAEYAASSRAALHAEIARRKPAIEAERAAIESERHAIQAEKRGLDALRQQIERRRRRGLLAVEAHLDRLDDSEHNRRFMAFGARVHEFNRRVEAQRHSVDEFNALVRRYNAGR